MKKKLHPWKSSAFSIKLFGQEILIAIGGTSEDFGKWFAKITKEDKMPPSNPLASGRTLFGDGYYAMWTRDGYISNIAHEAVHVSWNLLTDRGIAMDEELLSYMVGHVTRNYITELIK